MAYSVSNFAHFPGEQKTFTETIFQADGVTPQDITGWHLLFTVHEWGNPLNIFYQKSTPDQSFGGISITNGPGGVCTIGPLAITDTSGMPPGGYEWYIQRVDVQADPTVGAYSLIRL